MIYGYARVSTPRQSIDRQIQNIYKAIPDVSHIYQESYTGTTTERPEYKKLLKKVKKGDTIIFESVSRMSRTAQEGFEMYQDLHEKGITLIFIKEPQINTETYDKGLQIDLPDTESDIIQPILNGVKLALRALQGEQIRQAFLQAEKEVKDLQERTKEGMRVSGAPKKISEARTGKNFITAKEKDLSPKIKKLSKDFDGSLKDTEIISLLSVSRNTYYKYKRKLKK